MAGYDFASIEKKWQDYWQRQGTFRQPNPGETDFVERPKLYVLDMFPYPSGAGLHVGHPEGYTATDIVSRYFRMKGYNVLHPMGYDAFGLPAEQYAVEHGVHPRETTLKNIDNIERQIKMFGFSYDWSRRISTTDVEYYRWTQWIFLQLYNAWYDPEANAARPIRELINRLESGELVVDIGGNVVVPPPVERAEALTGTAGGFIKFPEMDDDQKRRLIDEYRLAYMDEVPVNWCPKLGTVLANEEVTNEGRSDRGDHPVFRRALKQWMLRITAYAERLLEDLELVNWPEPIKIMQRNWIGKSIGAEVDFVLSGRTGVPPVPAGGTAAFKRLVSDPKLTIVNARSFCPKNPYPPGEPSPGDLMKTIRHLPHALVEGATYFVTFTACPGITFDAPERDIVYRACLHWHNQKCCVYGLVVMDDHVHLIVRPYDGEDLTKLLHSIKSFTSHEIVKLREGKGSIWQEESFDHVVRDSLWLTHFLAYIAQNPVRRKLVDAPDEYDWLWLNPEELVVGATGEVCGYASARFSEDPVQSWFEDRQQYGFPPVVDDSSPPMDRPDACPTTPMDRPDACPTTPMDRRDACPTTPMDRRDACPTIRVYTTRPDTLFGATYMVLAPEHDLVARITTPQQKQAVDDYVRAAARKSELERTAESKEKTGVFTGAYAINPVNRQPVPIWVADYVMMGYGTGAIMAVPAHDTRDLEFARKFDLPVIQVVQPPEASTPWEGFVDDGVAVNSSHYDGMPTADFKRKIAEDLAQAGLGRQAVNYKLRDWLFSRQRYWGEPFPIVHCDSCGAVALPESALPLELPEIEDFTPASSDDPDAPPRPPLGKAADWVATPCPACGKPAQRELNTMPQWAGSCWYYLRYLDPRNDKAFVDPAVEQYWMQPAAQPGQSPLGIDLYVGGAEHAVLHLLYSRFWHKVLFDLGHVSTAEPFGRLFNQGMIRSFAYRDKRGVYLPYDQVDLTGDKPRHKATGEEVTESIEKMSKSLKNVVNPDDVIAQYGADTFRLYEMFMGPLEASKPWNTKDVGGVHRFLNRVWRMVAGDEDTKALLDAEGKGDEVERALHRLTRKVGEDVEAMKFNTAIAAMMDFVNTAFRCQTISRGQAGRFVLLLAPFAPHIAEELWQKLGHDASLAGEPWPTFDPALLVEQTIEMPVQVNGKLRGRITVPAAADQEAVLAAALADAKVAAALEGKTVVKKIVVPGKLVNLVVK